MRVHLGGWGAVCVWCPVLCQHDEKVEGCWGVVVGGGGAEPSNSANTINYECECVCVRVPIQILRRF